MATVTYTAPSSATSLLTTGLNSLANGARAISSTVADNRDLLGDFELVVDLASAPTADSPIYLYFLEAPDGTNLEDGGTGITPSALPDVVFTVRAVNTAQRIVRTRIPLPNGDFAVLLVNGSGQAMEASGNTVKMWTYGETVA
jgi:hypothetical protein